MDSNPPSSGDFAWSQSQDNAIAIKDAAILIEWLSQRVDALEEQVGMLSIERPELPSQIQRRRIREALLAEYRT